MTKANVLHAKPSVIGAIAGIAGAGVVIAFFSGAFDRQSRAGTLPRFTYCEQAIQQCTSFPGGFDCLYTNTTQVVSNPGALGAYYYDANGVMLERESVVSASVYPGQTVHMQFPRSQREAASAKLCSIDPNTPLGRGLSFTPVSG